MAKIIQRGDRAIFYHRDSIGRHEQTPPKYVEWVQSEARQRGLIFDGTSATITAMIRDGRSVVGDIYLDYDVQGHRLERPALDACLKRIADDRDVGYLFIPLRSRLARPKDPEDGMKLEKRIRRAGVNIHFQDDVAKALGINERADIGEQVKTLVSYEQAGKYRRDLAETMLKAQGNLAEQAFSAGGRSPFFLERWLISPDGQPIRALQDGEVVRMKGHHVAWLPKTDGSLELALRIVSMLEKMPASRVANQLTLEGIPSPDANRTRKDRGIVHKVSGAWHATTIVNTVRSLYLVAQTTYGKRSMGDQLRHSQHGPRELEESDLRRDLQPKVIRNDRSEWISVPARYAPLVDPQRIERLIAKLDERAGSLRNKPRSQDPANNPLGGRVFDMSCGWPMYREPVKEQGEPSFRYKCGAYTQSHGAYCDHNHVSGPLAAKFVLSAIRQRLASSRLRELIKERLSKIAAGASSTVDSEERYRSINNELTRVQSDLETVQRNLAFANTPAEYKAIAPHLNRLQQQEEELRASLQTYQNTCSARPSPEKEVKIALGLLDRIAELAESPKDFAACRDLFSLVDAKLYLLFEAVPWGKRMVRKPKNGILTFGAAPAPIETYKGQTGRVAIQEALQQTQNPGQRGRDYDVGVEKADSLGNVSRGDKI